MSTLIKPETDQLLRRSAKDYFEGIQMPRYAPRIGEFAIRNIGDNDPVSTLITMVDPAGMAVSAVHTVTEERLFFANVDLTPDSPASIVKPGFYNEQGMLDPVEGKLGRPVERVLTDLEGHALVADLQALMAVIASPPAAD